MAEKRKQRSAADKINVIIGRELKEKLRYQAESQGLNLSNYVRMILIEKAKKIRVQK